MALRAQGVKAGAPMFIPFVGAYVVMKEAPRSVAHEAWVALVGPVAGAGGSMIIWMVVAVGVLIWRPSPVLGFVLVMGLIEAGRRWREHRAGISHDYHQVATTVRAQIASAYVAVAALCIWGMPVSYVARPQ